MPVRYEAADGVAVILLDRPEKKNAFDAEMSGELEAAVDRLEGESGTWVGIITGAGATFCSGADLGVVSSGGAYSIATERGGWGGFVRRERDKPIIAAVEGWALAGGFEIALACDLIVAAQSARFGLPEVTRSLIAAAGGLIRLPRALSHNVAMEIALTGAPMSAQRAYDLGLVNAVCADGEALTAARELAGRVARNAPLAVQASRRVLNFAATGAEDDAWRLGFREAKRLGGTEDFAEGPRAFVDKRPPVWKGR